MSSAHSEELSASSDDDTSSLGSMTPDTDASSTSDTQPKYRFNEDLDALWDRCDAFSRSFTAGLVIHPLHLALTSLYDNLRDCHDARLHDSSMRTPAVERPLFWVALTKFAKPALHQSLDHHIKHTSCGPDVSLPLPVQLARALYTKFEGLTVHDFAPPEQADPIQGTSDNYCKATQTILDRAKEFSTENGEEFIAPHHILFALLEEESVYTALNEMSTPIPRDELAQVIRGLRKSKVELPEAKPRFPILSEFAVDETKEMQKNPTSQDPIVGRHQELRRIISILSRRSKNSAVLIGDPGVGKTAIARSLAWRIVKGEVSESVVARVFSLDLGSLLASTACKSAYEAILQAILDEIAEHEDMGIRAIVFIDELSQITIGGYRSDGTGIDAATLMKPYIRSGKLRCIGCATWEEYSSMTGKDGALGRLFSTVSVCEPAVPETEAILRSMKNGLQAFHEVHISDDAFTAASSIAARFFAHKRLPDSAIELVDEACSYAKIGVDPSWDKLGKWRRLQVAKEIHLKSLQREYDETSERHVAQLQDQLHTIEGQIQRHRSAVNRDRPLLEKLKELEDQIRKHDRSISELGKGQYEDKRTAVQELWRLKMEREEIRTQLSQGEQSESSGHNDRSIHGAISSSERPEVNKASIVKVASWYRPIHGATSNTKDSKSVDYHDILSKTVVMQPEAVKAIADAAQCLTSGLSDPSRPAASFLFGGPSGSGKILLAKQVAEILLGSADKLIRIHGGDYAQSHSLARLIGTPVCTGFDKGGQLTECVRRRPISVVLIQEIEKACPEFRQFIQTILEEGSVKDGEGRLVDFTNCMVIITTNMGQEATLARRSAEEERKQFILRIQQSFPAEFLARIDDLLVFHRITEESMPAIVDHRLQEVAVQLQRVKLNLDVRDDAKTHLANVGWSSRAGASGLEGIVRTQVLLPISTAILQDGIPDRWTIRLSYDEIQDKIVLDPIAPTGGPSESTVDDSASIISALPPSEPEGQHLTGLPADENPRPMEFRERQNSYYYGGSSSSPVDSSAVFSRPTPPVTQPKPRRLY